LGLASLGLLTPVLLAFSAKKREGELTVAQGRVKDLESLFHRSEAELATALSDKQGLETEVAELRAQLAKVGLGAAGVPAP
jgi:lamin B